MNIKLLKCAIKKEEDKKIRTRAVVNRRKSWTDIPESLCSVDLSVILTEWKTKSRFHHALWAPERRFQKEHIQPLRLSSDYTTFKVDGLFALHPTWVAVFWLGVLQLLSVQTTWAAAERRITTARSWMLKNPILLVAKLHFVMKAHKVSREMIGKREMIPRLN